MGSKYKQAIKETTAPEKSESTSKTRQFEFPSNVRQIGGLNKGIKIYIEDYAYTYVSKLCAKKGSKDTAAFLVGYMAAELGEEILVISGAISLPFLSQNLSADGQIFTAADWRYAEGIVEKHFEGLEIVGWARLQPGYGLYLSAADISSHYLGFTEKHAVLFLCDPEEKLNCFFAWNENQDDLVEVSGYFIYYDKNNEMNSYISEMRGKKPSHEEIASGDIAGFEAAELIREEDIREDAEALSRSVDKAKKIAEIQRQKRIISMMTSVSVLLLFACVIMVIGLLQSGERISSIESQMKELKNGYNNVATRLNDNVLPAFAAQTEQNTAADGLAEAAQTETSGNAYVTEVVNNYAAASDETDLGLEEAIGIAAETEASVEAQAPPTAQAAAESEPKTAQAVYIVQPGDTLTYISKHFYGTTNNIGAIMEANGMTDPDTIVAGMKLVIP